MLNQTVLTGNLGADPEIFYGSEGQPIASFNLAFRVAKKKTGWIKVVCFNRLASTGIHSLAEITEKHLHKGARIGVIGTRSSFQLIANTVEFIKTDGRGFEGNQQPQDDDIPF
jgi:single-strand DNA-binding protein